MSERQVVLHYQEQTAQRLDKFLVSCLPEFSRSRLQVFIKNGLVAVDDQVVTKAGLFWRAATSSMCVYLPYNPVICNRKQYHWT